jgi:hypothetical protein
VVKSNGLEGESPSGLAERDVLFWLNELLIASNGTDSRAFKAELWFNESDERL